MPVTYSITYDKVTPESAEEGDFSEHGFISPGGYEHPIPDGLVGVEFSAWCAEMGPFDTVIEPTDGGDIPEWAIDAADCWRDIYQGHNGTQRDDVGDISLALACFEILRDLGGVEDNGDGSFYEIDAANDRDYFEKGEEKRRCVHFEGLSDVQLRLLSALVKAKL